MRKYGGPQYLDARGLPLRRRPDESHFSDELPRYQAPRPETKRQISPDAAQKIALALRILLKGK